MRPGLARLHLLPTVHLSLSRFEDHLSGTANLDVDRSTTVAECLVQACQAYGLELDQMDAHSLTFNGLELDPAGPWGSSWWRMAHM